MTTDVPCFVIDLDKSPVERWQDVALHFKQRVKSAEHLLFKELRSEMTWIQEQVVAGAVNCLGAAAKIGAVAFADELKAMAQLFDVPLGVLVALQLVYEASACCTSVACQENQQPLHVRTMDWEMPFDIALLTCELSFTRNGHPLFRATSWAGYVGILTGMTVTPDNFVKKHDFSISVNFRLSETGSFWTNIKQTLNSAWPVGFLVRSILQDGPSDYTEAVQALAASPLISPAYFTVAGVSPNQGCVITRSPRQEILPRAALDANKPFVIQTNVDHFKSQQQVLDSGADILWSLERASTARAWFQARDQQQRPITSESLWDLVSFGRILNSLTIYATLMVPATGLFETRLVRALPPPINGSLPRPSFSTEGLVLHRDSTCSRCGHAFADSLNGPGFCAHDGEWHSEFGHCSIKCAWRLGVKNLGLCHWSCCMSTAHNSICSKSKPHTI